MKNAEFNIQIDSQNINKEYFKDLVRYRELFYFLAWRDVLVRYKQAFFGIAWALFRPLLNMLFFAFIFGKIAHLPSDNVNYSLFVLAGLIPWQLFSYAIVDCSGSVVNNAHLISKIYFPRILIPTSAIVVHLIDFCISLVFLFVMAFVLGGLNGWTLPFLPLFIIQAIALCVGVGLWLSALTVKFRDFRFIVPFIAQFGMFLSPVGYGSFVINESWRFLYFLNPMAGIIEGFRWSLFGVWHTELLLAFALSFTLTLLILSTGFMYFRKMERVVADII